MDNERDPAYEEMTYRIDRIERFLKQWYETWTRQPQPRGSASEWMKEIMVDTARLRRELDKGFGMWPPPEREEHS